MFNFSYYNKLISDLNNPCFKLNTPYIFAFLDFRINLYYNLYSIPNHSDFGDI